MFAYLHHLYMDFAQPQWLQVVGQVSSYLISVPAAAVTIFQHARPGVRLADGMEAAGIDAVLGVMGWAIGGVAAVIDSTVMVNSRFHNTLWVPAHFHTYYVMGVVLMILGAVFHLSTGLSKMAESGRLTRLIVTTVGLGGYGFLLMFYLAGVSGVPRRYAHLPNRNCSGDPVREAFAGVHRPPARGGAYLHMGNWPAMCPSAVRLSRAAWLLLACVVFAAPSRGPRDVPPDEDRFINEPLPDIELETASGVHTSLSSVARGQPLLLTFVFTRCARRLLAVPGVMARRGSVRVVVADVPSPGSELRPT